MVNDREEREDESETQTDMRIAEVTQPGVILRHAGSEKGVNRCLVINSIRWLMTMAWCHR